MSLPSFLRNQFASSNYENVASPVNIHFTRPKYGIHFLSFATSNWVEAHRRLPKQLEFICRETGIFSTWSVMSESNLDTLWWNRFGEFTSDPGFAMWSWKPYLVNQKLISIPENDILFYLDGGCSFPSPNMLEPFITDLLTCCEDIHSGLHQIGLTIYPHEASHCEMIASRKLLNYFSLDSDILFRHSFPHWQAGIVLCRHDASTLALLNKWNSTFTDYEKVIKRDWRNEQGEHEMFYHAGGDQSILQALLYLNGYSVLDISNLAYGHGIVTHIRR